MPRLALLIAAGALICGAPAAALAQAPDGDAAFHATTLTLTADGETRLAPDQATITLGVETQGPTAAAAMAANSGRMGATIAALKAQGIDAKDIQTSGLSLNAQYAYATNQPPRLTGYQAANTVSVTVRDLTRLGGVVDAVVNAGANQVQGVAFGLANPQAAEDQARRAAVKALAAKAELYAQAAGYRVVRLVNLSEAGGYAPPQPRPLFRVQAAMAQAPATPVEPGELKVQITVSGVYELAR